jgi:AcrR family transcriptional regulator
MRSGSPFYHFENKEALLAAVMEDGMQRALANQRARMAEAVAASRTPLTARDCLRVLVRGHFDNLVGPESDHIPVMLYEWRVLSDQQKHAVNRLKDEYEAVWVPVLQALRREGVLGGDQRVARLMLFGALNWTAQWFVPDGPASLDDLTDTTLQLFLKDAS